MSNTPVIQTQRLILRKFTPKDLHALFALYSDAQVNTFLPWFPLACLQEAETILQEKYLSTYAQQEGYKYAICLKTDNTPIGYVHIANDESHDLGYGLRKEYWHQGIVTEACKAVIQEAKNAHITYLTATHDVCNPRSGQVMKNIGMTYCYSYQEQWQPKNKLVTFRMYQLNLDSQKERVFKKYWDNSSVHFIEENV